MAHRSVLHRRRGRVRAVPKCLPKRWHVSQHSGRLPLRVCERLDRWWLQREHWWLRQCSLLPWSHMPRPCGIILLWMPTWAHWWVREVVCDCTPRLQLPIVLTFYFVVYFIVYLQVCCVIWMTPASVTRVRKAPIVTPTLSMAWPSAPALLAIPALPAIRTLTSAPWVIANHSTVYYGRTGHGASLDWLAG